VSAVNKVVESGYVCLKCHAISAEQAQEPVGINGLTEAETSASMSVMGLSKPAPKQAITPETGNAATPEASAITSGNGQAQEPVAIVAEVHMSRYTLEWLNGPLPEGTELYAHKESTK
jgi:hypothetical protein